MEINYGRTGYIKQSSNVKSIFQLPLNRDHRRILAMFRCGNLPLHIETGRYARPKIPVSVV